MPPTLTGLNNISSRAEQNKTQDVWVDLPYLNFPYNKIQYSGINFGKKINMIILLGKNPRGLMAEMCGGVPMWYV